MGVNSSKVRFTLDAAAAVTLRNIADGAETATATETAVPLNELDTAYWQDGNEVPYGVFGIQVNVTTLDKTTGDETYVLSLLVDDTSGLSDAPVTIASFTIPAVGAYVFYVDSKTISKLDPDTSGTDKWLAIRATLGGTTPSITYGAFIAKTLGA
jgi:hypothetical protein